MNDIGPPSASAILTRTPSRSAAGLTLPPGYIHLGVSKEIVPTLRAFGLDPDPLIHGAGLEPQLFGDSTTVVPFADLARME